MAVQLPIQRNPLQSQGSVGRMDLEMPDVSQAVRVQGAAAGQLAESVTRFVVQEEENTANTAAREAQWEFHRQMNEDLERIKQLEGDPDQAYAQWEEKATEASEKLREKYKGSSTFVNDRVNLGIQEEYRRLVDRKTVSQAAQRDKYRERVYEANTGQIVDFDFPESTASLSFTRAADGTVTWDPRAGADTYAAIVRLEKVHEERGLQNGTVTRREDGSLEWSPVARDRFNEARSKGLVNAIKVLSDVGEVEKAEFLQEKFGSFIDKTQLKTARGETAAAKLEREALTWIQSNRSAGQAGVTAKIDSIKDPVLQNKVRNLWDDELNQKKRIVENLENSAYRNGMQLLEQERQKLGREPTLEEMRRNPNFRAAERSSGVKAKALRTALGEYPKSSDPSQFNEAMQFINTPEFFQSSWEDVNLRYPGLSKGDHDFLRKAWRDGQVVTEPEKRQALNFMNKNLTQLLISNGYLRSDGKNKGRVNPRDQQKQAEAYRKLIEATSNAPIPQGADAQLKYVQSFANSLRKDEAFIAPANRPPTSRNIRQTAPVGESPSNANVQKQSLTERAAMQRQRAEAQRRYMRQNSGSIPTPQQLDEFIRSEESVSNGGN